MHIQESPPCVFKKINENILTITTEPQDRKISIKENKPRYLLKDAASTAGQTDVNSNKNIKKYSKYAFSKTSYLNFLLRFRR